MNQDKDTVPISFSHYTTVFSTVNIQFNFHYHYFQPYYSWQIYSYIFNSTFFNRIVHHKYTVQFSLSLFSAVLFLTNIQLYFDFHIIQPYIP